MSQPLPDYWDCFANDYSSARQAFVDDAAARGAALFRYENPTLKDPQGEALSVDVAVLGRRDALLPRHDDQLPVRGRTAREDRQCDGAELVVAHRRGDATRFLIAVEDDVALLRKERIRSVEV